MPSKYERALDRARRDADIWQDRVAVQARKDLVIPFCEKHGYKFVAGMGSWSFHREHGSEQRKQIGSWNEDLLPKRLREVLQLDAIDCNNSLGSLMPDYTPKNWRTE